MNGNNKFIINTCNSDTNTHTHTHTHTTNSSKVERWVKRSMIYIYLFATIKTLIAIKKFKKKLFMRIKAVHIFILKIIFLIKIVQGCWNSRVCYTLQIFRGRHWEREISHFKNVFKLKFSFLLRFFFKLL